METKERPILFSAPMVKAILEGRKTQTRRVMKVQPSKPENMKLCFVADSTDRKRVGKHHWGEPCGYNFKSFDDEYFKCPCGQVGDELWVRENFKVVEAYEGYDSGFSDDFDFGGARVRYHDGEDLIVSELGVRDDGVDEGEQAVRISQKNGFSPSIHMPRWASRITLKIKSIRVERLKEISEEDAKAEGVEIIEDNSPFSGPNAFKDYLAPNDLPYDTAKASFNSLWESINGAESWEENPWVWVVGFEVVKP